ncbi:MAG: hypothetical protein LBT75_00200 [Bacilli bacterium]|jgi:hypothetical protein|nr:hypothetical protein [Bacilli bacterium]
MLFLKSKKKIKDQVNNFVHKLKTSKYYLGDLLSLFLALISALLFSFIKLA